MEGSGASADPIARGMEAGRTALRRSAKAAIAVADRSNQLEPALRVILAAPGRLIVTGLGKSGLVAAKLAATFASTGTPAHFVHAADALHGDAGMVVSGDVLLALSKSGETPEVVYFAHMVRDRAVPVIALTGCGGHSSLCRLAAVNLDGFVEHEGDRWDLVPTASTAVSLIIGDTLAVALMAARDFGPSDFKQHHPGGSLGDRLRDTLEAK